MWAARIPDKINQLSRKASLKVREQILNTEDDEILTGERRKERGTREASKDEVRLWLRWKWNIGTGSPGLAHLGNIIRLSVQAVTRSVTPPASPPTPDIRVSNTAISLASFKFLLPSPLIYNNLPNLRQNISSPCLSL